MNVLANLSNNSGMFTLTNGANFTAPGNLVNNDTLAVGPGSTLNVTGNFTAGHSSSFVEQMAGATSGQYGKTVIGGTASIDGNFHLNLLNGFTPLAGLSVPIATYGSETGNFVDFTGLPAGTVLNTTPTALILSVPYTSASLQASNVTTSVPTVVVGQSTSLTVNWTVTNQSPLAATGSWRTVSTSRPPRRSQSNSILLGTATHTGRLGASLPTPAA